MAWMTPARPLPAVLLHLSDEALLLLAPFRGYAHLVDREPTSAHRALAWRVAIVLGTIGVVGSLTTVGRLVGAHVLSIAAAWIFVPAIHAAMVAVTRRLSPTRLPAARAIELHMAGNGPYLALFFGLAVVVVVSPDVAGTFRWLIDTKVLPLAVLLTLLWASVTSYAFYRTCAGAHPRRAIVLLAAEWVLKVVLCLVWYASIDNLAPQFFGPRQGP